MGLILRIIALAFLSSGLLRADSQVNSVLSEFEKFIDSNGGAVPYPFNNLKNRIDGQTNPSANPIVTTLVPNGRSLVKEFANFSDPRFIFVAPQFLTPRNEARLLTERDRIHPTDTLNPQGAMPLFIGYAAKSDELEVISWNRSASQFDFILVKNYKKGGKPVIERPDRSVCLACHQNGGPLFPRLGWNESTPLSGTTLKAALHLSPDAAQIHIDGDGSVIDRFVRSSNKELQATHVCSNACGRDLACRTRLLLAGLARIQLKNDSKDRTILSKLLTSKTSANWPRDNFAYVSDVIPDRDPEKNSKHNGQVTREKIVDLKRFINFLTSPDFSPPFNPTTLELRQIESEYKSGIEFTYNDFGAHTAGLFGLVSPPFLSDSTFSGNDPNSKADPTSTRPKVSEIFHDVSGDYLLTHASDCFGLQPEDEREIENIPYAKLRSIVEDQTSQKFVSSWPPNRERIMEYIRARLSGKALAESFLCPIESTQIFNSLNQQNSQIALRAASKVRPKGAMEIFDFYCGKCHVGQNALVKDLHIKNINELRTYRDQNGQRLIDKVKMGIMPADAMTYDKQKASDWAEDKNTFLRLLENH